MADREQNILNEQFTRHHLINDEIENIADLKDNLLCTVGHFERLSAALLYWSNLIPNIFMRAVNSALLGKMTPDILPFNQLLDMLKKDPLLRFTPFMQNPSLVYKLQNPHSIYALTKKVTGKSSYSIGTGPIKINSSHAYRIKIPSLIAKSHVICSTRVAINSRNNCMSSLHNDTQVNWVLVINHVGPGFSTAIE